MTSISGTQPGDGDARGVGAFDPPAGFISRALITDLSVHAPAAAPAAWSGAQARELLDWERDFTETLDSSRPPFYRWFADGSINASVNCLDRHVRAGRGDRVAFHWVGEAGETRDVSYADLHRDVQRCADALRAAGVLEGDVVGVYLPMIPEVVVAMLACARIGAIHDVVFGGFSAESVNDRLASSQAGALVTVDGARRKGRTTPVKAALDAAGIDVGTTFAVRHAGVDCPMGDGNVLFDAALEAAQPVCEPAAPGLPKTRSGKIMRRLLRDVAASSAT